MNNEADFVIIKQCTELRSLKLIGEAQWVVAVLKKCLHATSKIEQLTVNMPDIKYLFKLLVCVSTIISLRRLEICAEQLEEKPEICSLPTISSKIEQFILRTCSEINWNDLENMQPALVHVRFLDVDLLHRCKKTSRSFIFPCLRSLRISLLEIAFEWSIQLVATMPNLVKLKLTGLVDDENFAFDYKWLYLQKSAPTLLRIAIDVSLEQSGQSFHCENLQMALRRINLNLTCVDDDCDCYPYQRNEQRWWRLKGVITKQHSGAV